VGFWVPAHGSGPPSLWGPMGPISLSEDPNKDPLHQNLVDRSLSGVGSHGWVLKANKAPLGDLFAA
jgi:hypothetical protein